MNQTQSTIAVVHFTGQGQCEFHKSVQLNHTLSRQQIRFIAAFFNQTYKAIRKFSPDLYYALSGQSVRLRLTADCEDPIHLSPHELVVDSSFLDFSPKNRDHRRDYLIGLLEGVLYHLCNRESHITQVDHHSLHFYHANPAVYHATLRELSGRKSNPAVARRLEVLANKHKILGLEGFWTWAAGRDEIRDICETATASINGAAGRVKKQIIALCSLFLKSQRDLAACADKTATNFKLYRDGFGAVVFVYRLGKRSMKVIRVRRSHYRDAMATSFACRTIESGGICTDIFYDHGPYIEGWVGRLKVYSNDISLQKLADNLLADDIYTVQSTINKLYTKLRRKENVHETIRLMYAALYHSFLSDGAVSRSVSYRVSRTLEDLLTDRPMTFPQTRTNRSVFRGDKAVVRITVDKPPRIKSENIRARLQWAVNGNRKRTLPMELDARSSTREALVYEVELPIRRGWIHYAVQVSFGHGKGWHYEPFDANSQGQIKFVADERGERVLSMYADTFNLKLDENFEPVRDELGAYVYGSFDELAEQLEGIRTEGFTRIYPLGALELGWAGEAGPDPSVFSILDGKTVRPDLGGLEGLLRLKERADKLNMKVILCVMSHFSKANTNYPYRLPVYIRDKEGNIVRRSGWDGESSEWHDSFMVNMREFENVEFLSNVCEELSRLGFGLRIDVGHGFDTVFPADSGLEGEARLFGDITQPGVDRVDLRGTKLANIPILYACYRAQKANPSGSLVYSEQWHGNEMRMIKSGTIPYNAIIKNLEHIRGGQDVHHPQGLNDNMRYLKDTHSQAGGQTLSLFNSHDEESPTSNYQNMIWPTAAFLVFSSYGAIIYHISRLPGAADGSFRRRFDLAYLECWKHWVNNRFAHPWSQEIKVRDQLVQQYPLLKGFGTYMRGLFQVADDLPALTKGTLTPLETNNGRIAAFLRSCGEQTILCVFNFPNPHHEGQQAVPREFNFRFRVAGTGQPVMDISADETYELKERYNNAEGRQRRSEKTYWSGEELLSLGFGGTLPPVSSQVYEVIYRDHAIHEKMVLPDSFLRYFRYGKDERVRHAFIARTFHKACLEEKKGFERFSAVFVTVMEWLLKYHKLGICDLSTVLGEICEYDAAVQGRMIDYLMRMTVNEGGKFEEGVCKGAGDILQSICVGPIVLVSPESKFSGTSGGVGLYTTDIADVLSEIGFRIIIVTPLYECNRRQIFEQYSPRYDGHSFNVQFPRFREDIQYTEEEGESAVVNLYRTRLVRYKHGKRAKLEVFYLENSKYFDQPYGGSISEDKLRRARMLSQGALEAIRIFNVYPSVIQTNEWPAWLVPAYLYRWQMYHNDPHFRRTQVLSMMHNPHPSYSIALDEANPAKRHYYARVLGLDPLFDIDLLFDTESSSGHEINLTHTMLMASPYIGTVSRAMQERILAEPWLFGHSRLFRDKYENGRFFARRNGFNMGARQRFWFGGKNSLLETYSVASQRRMFLKYTKIKGNAKRGLQNDPNIRICPDDDEKDHIIFGMLHRICRQKGFELLVDWKAYDVDGERKVYYEPWKTDGATVLEYFLSHNPLVQFVICGSVEDSPDGRRFHRHLQRVRENPYFSGRFGYFSQGALPPSLYRNLYLGSQFFVMPSGGDIGEPCGISQQEAHAGGTPVVAHHQDGLIRTVADRDFGDTNLPPNGIKFRGFTGETLLDALLDAAEIYKNGRRRLYQDKNGNPRKLRYAELSFNAFRTDHRWLRLLHDYAQMYALIKEVPLPQHLHAVQLVCEIQFAGDNTPAEAILRKGLAVSEGVRSLIGAADCEIASVSDGAIETLKKLCQAEDMTYYSDLDRLLREVSRSSRSQARQVAETCLAILRTRLSPD